MPLVDEVTRAILEGLEPVVAQAVREALVGGASRAAARGATTTDRPKARGRSPATSSTSRARTEITEWKADKSARRVPLFVQAMTNGLNMKRDIERLYGPEAVFKKGGPVPPKLSAAKAAGGEPEGGPDGEPSGKAKPQRGRKTKSE